MFVSIADKLSSFDYVFFFNANAFAIKEITADMILPKKENGENICVVKHPAYRNCKPFEFPYDRNFKCKACIPYGFGKIYVQGCLIGGTTTDFLHMSKAIATQIDKDLKKNVIALWHDESYLNRYILKHKDFRLLGIEFANPLSDDPANAIIHMRQKNKYFNVDSIKENITELELCKFNRLLNNKIFDFLSKKSIFKHDYKANKEKFGRLRAFIWGAKNIWKIPF